MCMSVCVSPLMDWPVGFPVILHGTSGLEKGWMGPVKVENKSSI